MPHTSNHALKALKFALQARPSCNRHLLPGLRALSTSPSTQRKINDARPDQRKFSSSEKRLNFDGRIFSTWPKSVLLRNSINFSLCQYDFLLNHAEKTMTLFYRVPILRGVMKWFIYNQFVGGDTIEEVKATARDLERANIEPMLAIPMETENLTPEMDVNAWQEGNLVKMIDSLEKAQKVANNHPPVVHLKVTGIMDEALFLKVSEFVGFDWHDAESGAAARFEKCVEALVELMRDSDSGSHESPLFAEILGDDRELRAHVATVAKRYEELAQATVANDVECAIDAEYVNINPAIAVVTMAMARRANTAEKAYIWNTYQCYLKKTKLNVDFEVEYLRKHGQAWGAKIVRGAYMEKERLRAEQGGYPDPVNDTIEDTHANYNNVIRSLIEKMELPEYRLKVLVASHNEETVKMAYNLRENSSTPENVIFGQLFGMCDHISSELGNKGVPIYKSMPVGSFEDVMPYLARRGSENKSVMKGNHAEATLLKRALFSKKVPQ